MTIAERMRKIHEAMLTAGDVEEAEEASDQNDLCWEPFEDWNDAPSMLVAGGQP